MILEELMERLEIDSDDSFRYFEQMAGLMEEPFDVDYDTFAELISMPDPEALKEMTESFFEDLIKGIPDNDTNLYSAIQEIKEALVNLAADPTGRGRGFYTDGLFRFRNWMLTEGALACTPEDGGAVVNVSPLEALMLYREEKLSGRKYNYDFAAFMPETPDEYTLNIIAELEDESRAWDDRDYDREYEEDELPVELPYDFDPDTFDPENDDISDILGPIDPYRDGFVDRYDPVIEGIDILNDNEPDDILH